MSATNLLFSFMIGVFVLTVYGLFYCFFFLGEEEKAKAFSLGHSYYSSHILIHPTYLSAFLVLIFFFLMEYFRKNRFSMRLITKVVVLVLLVYTGGLLFFLKVRMSFVIFFVLLLLYGFIRMERKTLTIFIAALILILIIFSLASSNVRGAMQKYGRNPLHAVADRVALWQSAFEGYKCSPFLGAGTGGAQYLIDEGYLKTGYNYGLDHTYNAHNQYLQFLCRNGLLELVVFIALLCLCFNAAISQKSILFLFFLICMTLNMVSESMLHVQKGIVFFYFFVSAFLFLKYE
jgi:O-antigen ligase